MTIRPFEEWVRTLSEEDKEEMILYNVGTNDTISIKLVDFISR